MQGPRDRLRCGLCTGGIRLYRGTLHGRPIADWKHTDAPPGTQPHRPILGTPVDQATLDRIHRAPRTEEPKRKPKPPQAVLFGSWPAQDHMFEDSQSISGMLKLADEEGWETLERLYRELTDGTEYIIVKLRRGDLGAAAIWTRGKNDTWVFDEGYALSHRGFRQVQSTSLKEWLKTRPEDCPDCGRSSYVHTPQGECP